MTMTTTFTIQPVTGKDYHYDFIGSIDANCASVLDTLSDVPPESHVLLDFSKVERVNSMGLSLLLKLFEQWERNKIHVEVQHLNRMINMLFKITGLGRFVAGEGHSDAANVNPEPPRHAEQDVTQIQAKTSNSDKLNFVASLQSGQQLTGWYLLNTYLQRRLTRAIHFEQSIERLDPNNIDLLFAKPFEACSMIKKGFVPVMRPIAEVDEVVILTRADDDRALSDYAGVTVSTATEDSFVYLLGRFLCDENGLDSGKFEFDFAGNEIKALQNLIRKKSDLLFMLKKTYEGLSSFSRNNIRKLDESVTDFACHLFCVAPHLKTDTQGLVDVLADMANDEQGKEILKDIQIQGWQTAEADELQMLQMVYDRYAK